MQRGAEAGTTTAQNILTSGGQQSFGGRQFIDPGQQAMAGVLGGMMGGGGIPNQQQSIQDLYNQFQGGNMGQGGLVQRPQVGTIGQPPRVQPMIQPKAQQQVLGPTNAQGQPIFGQPREPVRNIDQYGRPYG